MLTFGWLIGSAWAADCPAPVTLDHVADDLGAVEAAIRDGAPADEPAARLRDGLPCLREALPRVVVGRVYRAIGAGQLPVAPTEAQRWLTAGAVVDAGFRYSLEELPSEEHPLFPAWDAAVEAARGLEPVTVEGKAWADGSYTVDGRRMSWPTAEASVPHVVQRTIADEVVSWVIDGAAFPDEVMVVAAAAPTEALPPTGLAKGRGQPTVDVTKVKTRDWPVERVVLVGGGSAALVGGGVLYGLALDKRSQFDASQTQADTERLARGTNTLTVASTAALAAGVGTLGFGVLFFIIDGDPRPTLDFRF